MSCTITCKATTVNVCGLNMPEVYDYTDIAVRISYHN
jgi:hypothetical protein